MHTLCNYALLLEHTQEEEQEEGEAVASRDLEVAAVYEALLVYEALSY